ncbi:unnamed protein product [Pylaiella littoralis]
MRRGFGGSEDEFGHHLMLKSADNKTIMMHATASGDSMVLKMVADACRKTIRPQAFWGMITDRGSDGLNLVMHAASCCATPSTLAPAEPSLVNPDIRNKKYEETPGIGDGSSSSDSSAQQGAETPLKETTATTVATNASITTIGAVTIDTASGNTTKKSTVEQMVIVEEDIKNRSGPVVVPVFKVAVHLLEECLWVAEVLEQMRATDLWGTSVLTHALLSGHDKTFKAAYGAIRDHVTDEQEICEMMETNEGEREDTPMIEALARGDTTMQKLFALRASQLKASDVDQRSELSSMNAEIQSFILGKLIVVFQLLLPQIAEARQLLLLFVMFFIAPIAKVAAESTSPDSKHSGFAARCFNRFLLSVLVGAPAMFFRGVGTSTVGASFGWSESLSATSMAAATLVIPAVDSFFNSQKASLWSAKLCCKEWRFNWKAYWHLSKVRETSTTKPAQIELPSYSTFSKRPDAIASSRGIEEEKQGAAASAATPILTEHESPDAAPIFTPLGSPEDTIRKSETA